MFPFFPYSNFHRLNADWILKKVQELATAVEGIAANVESWAARIQQAETDAADAVATANNAQALIGRAVRWDEQSLTDAQQARARANIGAASPADIPDVSDVVRYSPQVSTETQKTRARLNIGATSQNDVTLLLATKAYVRYDEQTLTPAQQVQARANIGAAYSGDVEDLADRVSDVEDITAIALTSAAQSLTDAQKAQARTNIGAGSAVDVQTNANEIQTIYGELNNLYPFVVTFSGTTADGNAACDKTWSAISEAIAAGKPLIVRYLSPGYSIGSVDSIYILSATIGSGLGGKFLELSDPTNPGYAYTKISCTLSTTNTVSCIFEDV